VSAGPGKERVDVLLVARGLSPSREKARALVLAGVVYVGERRIEKAGDTLPLDCALAVRGRDHNYVSRGGVKLAGALDAFAFDARGLVCADFGASTGGFTDCLLRRGAARVYAIDVGYGQLHASLRSDPRVVVMERTNARNLTAGALPEPLDLVVIDASFISLAKLLPAARALLRAEGPDAPGGEVVAMVKPQFEVGRERLGKRGVVRDPVARDEAIRAVEASAAALGLAARARSDSVLPGPEGNVEAFLRLVRVAPP
jgi:23S rRNA (cytidine1920-2'-O)/16S rRNA (cytidine1409-2'-O)-methyltransferase